VPAAVQGKAASVACSSSTSITFALKASGGGGTFDWNPAGCLLPEDVPAGARAPAVVNAVGAGGQHRVYLVRWLKVSKRLLPPYDCPPGMPRLFWLLPEWAGVEDIANSFLI
jgi:hypothetical protein